MGNLFCVSQKWAVVNFTPGSGYRDTAWQFHLKPRAHLAFTGNRSRVHVKYYNSAPSSWIMLVIVTAHTRRCGKVMFLLFVSVHREDWTAGGPPPPDLAPHRGTHHPLPQPLPLTPSPIPFPHPYPRLYPPTHPRPPPDLGLAPSPGPGTRDPPPLGLAPPFPSDLGMFNPPPPSPSDLGLGDPTPRANFVITRNNHLFWLTTCLDFDCNQAASPVRGLKLFKNSIKLHLAIVSTITLKNSIIKTLKLDCKINKASLWIVSNWRSLEERPGTSTFSFYNHKRQYRLVVDTGWAQLIRTYSSARFFCELSGIWINCAF